MIDSESTGDGGKTKAPLTLGRGKLELKKTVETGQVRQSFSHGRSKVVQVERKRKRQFEIGADGKVLEVKAPPAPAAKALTEAALFKDAAHGTLTEDEKAHRLKVLQDSIKADEEARRIAEEEAKRVAEDRARRAAEPAPAPAPEAADAAVEIPTTAKAADAAPARAAAEAKPVAAPGRRDAAEEDDEDGPRRKHAKTGHKPPMVRRTDQRRREGKLTLSAALGGYEALEQRGRSVAAMRRAVQKEKRKAQMS